MERVSANGMLGHRNAPAAISAVKHPFTKQKRYRHGYQNSQQGGDEGTDCKERYCNMYRRGARSVADQVHEGKADHFSPAVPGPEYELQSKEVTQCYAQNKAYPVSQLVVNE